MSDPTLTLIVSTYNAPHALAKVFNALRRQRTRALETIVADDGSGEETVKLITETAGTFPGELRHCWQSNKGFRKAVILNKAISMARGDYLVFLDGDCVPEPEFVADHAALAERGFWVQGRRAFVDESCVPEFVPTRGRVWKLALTGRLTGFPKALRLPFPIIKRGTEQRGILGCNLGIWREDLVAINGYDESFVGWGREDADLANRLYHLGRLRKFVYGRAILYHLNHPTASRAGLDKNQSLLDETMRTRRIRAVRGLDQHAAK